MTKLAKLLILLNTAFSFAMMAWALSLLSNRIDWTDQKAKDDQPPGELAKRRARIEELWTGVRPAEAAWRDPHGEIVTLERRRPEDRRWYAAELQHLFTGAKEGSPARGVQFERGVPAQDPANFNRPRMVNVNDRGGQPLQAMTYYDTELDNERAKLVKEIERHDKLVKEDTALTVKLVGGLDPLTKMMVVKGLRQRLIDERTKLLNLDEEEKLVKPLLINTYVDSQLILKRAELLKARIEELERLGGTGVAAGR